MKAGEVSEEEAPPRWSRSPHWVWVALDPVTTLVLAIKGGDRTLAMAQCLVHQVAQVLAPDCVPLFLTDGFKEYLRAVLTQYGHWVPDPGAGPPAGGPNPAVLCVSRRQSWLLQLRLSRPRRFPPHRDGRAR